MLEKILEFLVHIKSFFTKKHELYNYEGDPGFIHIDKKIEVKHLNIPFPPVYRNISIDDLENFIQTKLKDIKRLEYNNMNVYELMEEKSWTDHEINMLLRYNKLKRNLFIVDYSVLPNWINQFSERKINYEIYDIINKHRKTVNKKLPIYRYRKNYNWSVYEALIVLKYLHIKKI